MNKCPECKSTNGKVVKRIDSLKFENFYFDCENCGKRLRIEEDLLNKSYENYNDIIYEIIFPYENDIMKITPKIYEKACKAIEDGYRFVIISKNKKSYKNNVAIGEGFEIVSLIDIEESCDLSRNHNIKIKGRYLKKGEKIDLNRYHIYIKYSDLMKKYSDNSEIKEMEGESFRIGVPYLFFTSRNLIEARSKNYWFCDDSHKGDKYIYVNYNRFSGVFTFDGKTFKYRNGNKYVVGSNIKEIALKAKKLDKLIK